MGSKREPTQSEKLAFTNSSLIFTLLFSYLSPRFDKGKGGIEIVFFGDHYSYQYPDKEIEERFKEF